MRRDRKAPLVQPVHRDRRDLREQPVHKVQPERPGRPVLQALLAQPAQLDRQGRLVLLALPLQLPYVRPQQANRELLRRSLTTVTLRMQFSTS